VFAAVYYGRGDVRIEDVAEPSPGPGEIKIRNLANGICGTDLKEYYAGPVFTPVTPHPLTGQTLPVILGHEFCGRVTEVGDGVSDIAPGTLVAVEPVTWCGICEQCVRGAYNLCPKIAFHGVMTDGGGLAEYTVVTRRMVHPLPAGFTAEQGALIEPLCVAYHGVVRSQLEPGQRAAVFGAGPSGIGAFLGLRARGVEDIIVVEPSASRRAAVERLGAKVTIDPTMSDVASTIVDLTDGHGVDASLDAAGTTSSLLGALASTTKSGRIVTIAVFEEPVPFQPNNLLFTEIEITSSMAYCNDFPEVIDHMARGAYPTDGWVDHIGLDQLVDEGFPALRSATAIKVMVDLPGAHDHVAVAPVTGDAGGR
jgi:(R,R)-butanediol dehydrogenase/meso-butanediol dehydrogenase/diacetyl reductase